VKLPKVIVELELPAIVVVPLELPRVRVPVPLAWRVKPVLLVLAEIVGLAPEKVKAEAPRVSVLYVPPVTDPPLVTEKLEPFRVKAAPERPMVVVALVPPMVMVGVPLVKVPVSIITLPDAPLEALPDCRVTFELVVPLDVPNSGANSETPATPLPDMLKLALL
jgi:hypothetical protein